MAMSMRFRMRSVRKPDEADEDHSDRDEDRAEPEDRGRDSRDGLHVR